MSDMTPVPAATAGFSSYQKWVVALLAFLQFTVILDFMIISPLGAILMPTLKITPAQFGLVVSIAWSKVIVIWVPSTTSTSLFAGSTFTTRGADIGLLRDWLLGRRFLSRYQAFTTCLRHDRINPLKP